jgi:hypothetical protein
LEDPCGESVEFFPPVDKIFFLKLAEQHSMLCLPYT